MAGPVLVIVAGVITAYLAVRSNDGLVDDDYYKQGLAVNQTTEHLRHAARLGLKAEFLLNADATLLRIYLSGKAGVVLPEVLKLRIAHPTRAGGDQNLILKADGRGSYTGSLAARLEGRWHVTLEDDKSEWRMTGDWVVDRMQPFHLPVDVPVDRS